MPFQLGIPEVILVLVIALVFLGPSRMPEAGNAIGRGIREFRAGITGDDERPEQPDYEPPRTYIPPPSYVPPADPTAAYTPPERPAGRNRRRSRPAPDRDPVAQLEPAAVAPADDAEDVGGGDAVGERPGDQPG
jgi:sec-independent protein translocase protein TatA